jgi:TolB-like protein/DNA-binding winged helix-turn-helix (wHTH) protein/Tfp pilus assembly protein PilF
VSGGASSKAVLRFDSFELDLESGELRKAGQPIHLTGQPFRLLALLAGRAGHVLDREHIRQELWGADTFVDFDQGVNFCIKQIRVALGDDAKNPRYIETLPRRGYRFLGRPEVEGEGKPKAAPSSAVVEFTNGSGRPPVADGEQATAAPSVLVEGPAGPSPSSRHGTLLVALAVVALAAAALAGWLGWRKQTAVPAPAGRIMLAVLPFDNMSGDREQDYLSEGMTEEMITQLGRLDPDGLGVIARTSAMKYRYDDKDLEEIGRELGVSYLLTGSVRPAGQRIRINAQLIKVSDRTNMWAGSYEREFRDLLSVQAEVATAIAQEIRIRLTSREQQRLAQFRPVNSQAYQAYLKGRFFWNKRSAEKVRKAIEYFEQAISADPAYAAAHAGLADCYTALGHYGAAPPAAAYPRARAAALRALEIDEQLAEAHAALAAIKTHYDWDWPGAEREYKRAIRLNPSYASAYQWYATYLAVMGRSDEAARQDARALELDPLSPLISTTTGLHLYFARQYRQAIDQHRKALELEPEFALARLNLGRAYLGAGMFPQAVVEFEKAVQFSDRSPAMLAALAQAYGFTGQADKAQGLLKELIERSKTTYISPYDIALVYVGLRDKDQAFAWLQKALEEHSTALIYLRMHPWADGLRSDPRFQDLLGRLRLPG